MNIKKYYTKNIKNTLYLCDNNIKVGDLVLTDNGLQYKITYLYEPISFYQKRPHLNPVQIMNNPSHLSSGFYNFHFTTYNNVHKPIGIFKSHVEENISFEKIPKNIEDFKLVNKGVLGSESYYQGEGFEG